MNELGPDVRQTIDASREIDTKSSRPSEQARLGSMVIGPSRATAGPTPAGRPVRMPSRSLGGEILLGTPFLGASMGVNAALATVRYHERGCSPSPFHRRAPMRNLAGQGLPGVMRASDGRAADLWRVLVVAVRPGLGAGW